MNKTMLIIHKEFIQLMYSWTGLIIAASFTFLSAVLFYSFAIGSGNSFGHEILSRFFYLASGLIMVLSVILSMRSISSEVSEGTILVYQTARVSPRALSYGKFFSIFFYISFLLALTIYLPMILFSQNQLDFGQLLGGYIGLLLLAAAMISMGLFSSTLSSNGTITSFFAGLISAIFLLVWIVADIAPPVLREVLAYIAIHNQHFRPFQQGTVVLRDIVFYVSIGLLFMEWTIISLSLKKDLT